MEFQILLLGFDKKIGWELGFCFKYDWALGFAPPPPLHDPLLWEEGQGRARP